MSLEKYSLEFNGERLELVKIPAVEFEMGSVNELPFALETPVHRAAIDKDFWLGVFPVTQEQFFAVMNKNPAEFRHAPNLPVENVTWFEAREFCEKLSETTGKIVRLPSETEWEYAARGGSQTEFFFGDDAKMLPDFAWFELNSNERTNPVGLKKPNAFGLFDIVGNVWEWCEDAWKGDYENFPADGSPFINEKQPRRAVRGGAWNMDAHRCRPSYRSFDWADAAHNRLGFRVAVEI